MKTENIKPVLKYPGSKWRLAEWIISFFPEEYETMTYLEPFFGSGAVFFNKKRSYVETINDLDSSVINLFNVIRHRTDELAAALRYTPWSREEYQVSYIETGDPVEDARRFIVRMWQAIGSKSSDRTGWRSNIKGINGNIGRFHNKLPNDIELVAQRLKHSQQCCVQIENQDAMKLIERYNRSNVLMYIDPPYVLSTRSNRIYKHEYTDDDHYKLLKLLKESQAKILISGYEHYIYDLELSDWHKYQVETTVEGGKESMETLWMNYEPNIQMSLFDKGGMYL